ncbi:hypothetical protein K7711_02920 [Nocardia sp. CA2R105]|uniref:hypothetical protein n=1 Tax=Nocardia coffeae TaxID=2873381 RepID=UPI001CA78C10|nr:hypothetical protein [Nocardia coffeae]MBY8855420.1 hypothetical protein [Nocardia coffeae]
MQTIQVGDKIRRHDGSVRRATPHQVRVVPIARAVLIAVAQREGTITYTELAEAVGHYSPQNIGMLLDGVAVDCRKRGEPNLPAVVVRADSDKPAYEYAYGDDEVVRAEQAKV